MSSLSMRNLCLVLAALITGLVALDTTWLMPGPLSRNHAGLEARCGACHPGLAGAPRTSCLSCKDRMGLILDRGIHANAPVQECAECHVEHRTRGYPLASAWVVPERLDHTWTGFDLATQHQDLDCVACHPAGQPYREVKATCAGCHVDFNPVAWDHEARTACRLNALHAGLECSACHDQGWGDGLAPSCTRCHRDEGYDRRQACTAPPEATPPVGSR